MGSQTLEILRQGIWASLTGGWFYDPHLDVFSNTFHLYIWLFLLCLPFIIYLYFPTTLYIWLSYCSTIAVLFGTIKCVNHALHNVYDTSECLEEPNQDVSQQKLESEKKRDTRTKRRDQPQDQDFLGIELQVLNGKTDTPPVECSSRNSYVEPNAQNVDADSITSDYTRDKPNSTIDLKVEIHRKNSSESSEEAAQLNKPIITTVNVQEAELVSENDHEHYKNKLHECKRSALRKFSRHGSEDTTQAHYSKSNNLGKTGSESQIKQTTSMELEHQDDFYAYWRYRKSGHRHNSSSMPIEAQLLNDHPQSMEVISMMSKKDDTEKNKITSHPQSLEVISKMPHTQLIHPQSLETIRASNKIGNSKDDNNLPLHPQSLETINSKKALPQNTLKRNQLQLLPYLSCGSEIVHPIAEQSDEQIPNENSGRYNHQDSYSPLLRRDEKDDRILTYTIDSTVDNDSANSREALIEEPKSSGSKRRFSNTSQSSSDLSDGEHRQDKRREKSKHKKCQSQTDEIPNTSGSIVGIDWLFENGEGEPWTKKIMWTSQKSDDTDASDSIQTASTDYLANKEPDSGSSSTTTLSLENEVKRKLLPQNQQFRSLDVDSKRQQGAIPKQSRSRLNQITVEDNMSVGNTSQQQHQEQPKQTIHLRPKQKRANPNRERRERWIAANAAAAGACTSGSHESGSSNANTNSRHVLPLQNGSNHDMSMFLSTPSPTFLAALLSQSATAAVPACSRFAALQFVEQYPNLPLQPRIDMRLTRGPTEVRGTRAQRYKRLHRSHKSRRHRPRNIQPPNMEPDFVTLSRFLLHLHHKNDMHHDDTVHYYRDESGELFPFSIEDKPISGTGHHHLPSSRVLSSEPNNKISSHHDKLMCQLLQHHLSQNAHCEGNYDITEVPNLSSNSYSSLSLNSAALSPPALSSPINNNTNSIMNNNNNNNNNNINNNNNNTGSPSKLQSQIPDLAVVTAFENQRVTYRQLLTDSIAERNRRLQNIFGNLNMASPHTSHSVFDTSGNQVPSLSLRAQQENLSWNRFVTEFIGLDELNNQLKPKTTRHYYKWKVGKLPLIKIRFDRLALLALLDRNLTFMETIASTFLAVAVAGMSLLILQQGFYKDIFAFLFCFVTAGCQYSLLKSVQPDAASPTHGFNRIVVFSRPIYFIMCTSIVMLLEFCMFKTSNPEFVVYGFQIFNHDTLVQIRNIMLHFILCFPLVFSLGLFPQINTFLMYLCEHTDIHAFGGTATTSLVSSIYCLCRSIITVISLYGFVYGALVEPKASQHILFSIFVGLLVAVSYHLSRSSSDPTVIWEILKANIWPPEACLEEKQSQVIENSPMHQKLSSITPKKPNKPANSKSSSKKKDVKIAVGEQASDSELFDPLPQKLRLTVKARLKNDLIVCSVIGILSFAIHASTIFTVLQPDVNSVLWTFTGILGLLLHYIMPQLRKQLPWLCLARPVLRSFEYSQFEVREPVRIMWFEKIYVYLCFFERNILYPILFIGALTESSIKISAKYGPSLGALIVVVCGLKSLRSSYADSSSRYLVVVFTVLLFREDFKEYSETFLVDYFITAILFSKIYELLLKIRFIVTYIAPWQITWGSAFHAFAQPFSVPHSAMLFLQAGISAILSTPLNPLLGSAIFISSYVRPVKFWERDYKTRRVDHSNTRMSLHLERNLGADDNNLNSIFYEQLTRSLQHSLYGDLALGRWGSIEQGDCFLLASDYLNCLVHVVQLGNGLVTFQLRGLEFRGTYCQQREVEAISEGIEDNDNCCCCEIGHFSHVLSVNAAFSQRWLAWEVASAKYVLEGYSISDNSAGSMLQVFDFRKVLVTYYVKSIIFYAIKSPKLKQWLENQEIVDALKPTLDKSFVDLDPVFNMNIDEDFDFRASGITRSSFCNVYLDWIQFCSNEQDKTMEKSRDSCLVSLCLALSLLGRRVLGAASHNTVSSVEFFLYGLHALFKGDFRITSVRDEWVLHDVDLLRSVVAKGVRMALKLHQDHFMSPDSYDEAAALYEAIDNHDRNLVISHEADPLWRNAILSGAPSLLALRHVLDEGIDEYKVIMLNKRFLSFRVIKMNRECVRGLWAGQQQELIYLRNRNPERGSIQNAKQALRNIINSSCDQPIGYPIYVSPLTTSYAETNEQLCSLVGGSLSFSTIKNNLFQLWRRARRRCGQGCSSGGSHDDGGFGNDGVYAMTTYNVHTVYTQSGHNTSGSQSMESGCQIGSSTGRSSLGRGNTSSMSANCRGSLVSMGKPASATLASLAGLLSSTDIKNESKSETSFNTKIEKEEFLQRVCIMDPNYVYDAINLGRRIDVIWPDEKMRQMGGRSGWQHWVPERGMEGCVVHRWSPNHRDPNRRSHVDKVILLVRIDDKYVPIAEQGIRDLGAEV